MIKRSIFIFCILLFYSYLSYGQSRSSIREKKMKSVYSNPKIKVQSLLDSADYFMKTDRDRSFDFLEQAFLLCLKPQHEGYQVKVYRKLGEYYEYYKQYELAGINYENSLLIKEKVQSDFLKYTLKAGEQYRLAGKPSKSLILYQSSYLKNLKSNDIFKLDIAFGDAYYDLQKFPKALEYYYSAEKITNDLALTDENTAVKIKIAKVLSNTNSGEAYQVLNQANVQSKANSNTIMQIQTESELADYYNKTKRYDEEIGSRNSIIMNLDSNTTKLESMDMNVRAKRLEEQVKIAKSYNNQNQYDSIIILLNSSELTRNVKDDNIEVLEIKKEAAKTLSEAYQKTGDEEKAIEIYEDYISIIDQLYIQKEVEYKSLTELNKMLSDHQWRINFLEKDKLIYDAEIKAVIQEKQLQEDQLRFQRWYIILLIIGIGLLIFALFMMYQRTKVQRKHNMMLDLKALRTQMNPHFIFNALNSVNNFIAKNDELNANKYLVRFSKLMRSILDNSDSDFIPLSKEIEVLDLYLQLENMRFPDKFSYEFNVDKNIAVKDFKIPPMLIQPYIENAIWHGLRYKEENGILKLDMKLEGEFLSVNIEDNGIGRTESENLKTANQKSTKSRGIKNTQKRLDILSKIYKEDIKIEINDVETDGSGTKVELWIPKVIAETTSK